jgi:FkbM family methyltransferase
VAQEERRGTQGCTIEMDLPNIGDALPGKAGIAFDRAALAASPRVRPDGGYLPPMVSYAQSFEDVMLRRALQDIECGFYVDIGAADPDVDSVTRWFYENGWRGINVEPDPKYYSRLEARRPEDKNLQCVIGAASANVLFNITASGGDSTGSAKRLSELTNLQHITTKPILVPAITLDQLLVLSCGREIDFLKIDAEDMEDDILGGASFVSQRPRIIVAEATLLNSQIPSHQIWEPKLLNKGYKFAWFDGLNRYYIRCEDEWRLELFKVPPCLFDNFMRMTIKKKIDKVKEQAARTEADLNRALAESKAEICAMRRQMAEASKRYEAALSEASANAASANARAEAIEGELQRITAEFERCKADLEARIEKLVEQENEYLRLKESLAQRDGDCRRLQERVMQLESSRRQLSEDLEQRESERRQLEESLAEQESEYQQLEERLAQQESETTRLAAERDEAAAQSLRWLGAAIPSDQDRLGRLQQYPFQARLYRSRLWGWLAIGPKRRRRILTAAASRARNQQNWELAARYYREALDLAPKRPALWVQYGHALKEAGNLVAAESAYRKSLDLDAGIADTYLQLGHVLKLQGKDAEAADAYLRSLTLAPGSSYAMYEVLALGLGSTKPSALETERTIDPLQESSDHALESTEDQECAILGSEDARMELDHMEAPPADLAQADGPCFFDPRAGEIYQKLVSKMIEKSV